MKRHCILIKFAIIGFFKKPKISRLIYNIAARANIITNLRTNTITITVTGQVGGSLHPYIPSVVVTTKQ